ncbi:MAG: hypothetical protein A2Y40_04830 [Candidatus Margulisbacteria bacterium GWF2_35_9]|nr:MAG: hypothetical protein A2Y40_04830 [Candidatus Margulisbacteria bacterium GWF2_35_9]
MAFDLLVDKKKQLDSQSAYRNKPRILYTQDQYLNIYLSKYNINQYVLFIKRDSEYSVAAWKGYLSEEVEYLKYSGNSLFVDLLINDKQMITISDIERFYSETIILPREVYPVIKNEREMWASMGGTHCFPLEKTSDGLFGFFICKSSDSIEKSKDVVSFVEAIYHWANEYHIMYKSNVAKMKIDQYLKFVAYVDKISRVENEENFASQVIAYYLDLYKSTKGIVYELKKGYYHPQKIQHVDFVRAYSRVEFQKLCSKDIIETKVNTDAFFEELGSGSVRVISINSKYVIVLKQVFSSNLDNEFLNTVIAITDRIHKCLTLQK